MNKIYSLLIIAFTVISCNCQKKAAENTSQKENQLPKLEYVANTRGYFQKITIENQMVTVSSDRNNPNQGTTVNLSDADAKELAATVNKTNLEALSTYKDPTQKRFYDGAAIANLTITKNGTVYKTVDFDNGFPPVEIEKLVNKITSFGKKD